MWYTLQIAIALGIAFFWATMPGHTPQDFGHGLFLGAILAWYGTLLITGVIEALNKRSRQTRASKALPVIRKSISYRGSHQ